MTDTGAAIGTGFGQGSGPILFSYVACNGDEFRLLECGNTVLQDTGCSHNSDAGVVCQAGN